LPQRRSIIDDQARITVMQASDRSTLTRARRLLGECVLFRGLSTKERSELVARARMRNIAAGETIFLMGAKGDSMMAVLDGNVRISVPSPEGKEIVLAIIQPGDVFGEIAVLDGKERTAEATAMTDCTLAVLERREVMAFLESNPSGWPRLVDLLCARLRHSDRQIAEMAFLQLPVRLAKVLLRMADMGAGLSGARSGARIRLTQRELGSVVGMTRESVNKCLRQWQRKGIIRVEDNAIVIAKREDLQMVADG
jgi:CRP/FNR family transcriptional regulator, cyclic AMP receptor protein